MGTQLHSSCALGKASQCHRDLKHFDAPTVGRGIELAEDRGWRDVEERSGSPNGSCHPARIPLWKEATGRSPRGPPRAVANLFSRHFDPPRAEGDINKTTIESRRGESNHFEYT